MSNEREDKARRTLKELSDAATPGPWNGESFRLKIMGRDGPIMSYQVGNKAAPEGMCVSVASERVADHQFVAALVNAYRAGELVEKASASSSCAAQEPIPEHYSLDEVAARTLRDWLNDGDGGLNDVTIHVGRGHGGPGLYVSLTEYPEEGAALLVEAPQNESRSAAAKPSAGTGS